MAKIKQNSEFSQFQIQFNNFGSRNINVAKALLSIQNAYDRDDSTHRDYKRNYSHNFMDVVHEASWNLHKALEQAKKNTVL